MNKDIISVLVIAVSMTACGTVETKKNETVAAITPTIPTTRTTSAVVTSKPEVSKPVKKPTVIKKVVVKKPKKIVKKPKRIVRNYMARGSASKYRLADNGKKTASGELYDLYGMTAAHASLPFYTKVRVKNLANGRSVVVTITDRLYDNSKLIKLSYWAARNLKLMKNPSPTVLVKTF
jgi:rare lipoprotein A